MIPDRRPEPYATLPTGSSVELWVNAKGHRQWRVRVAESTDPDELDGLIDRTLAAADRLDSAEAGPLASGRSAAERIAALLADADEPMTGREIANALGIRADAIRKALDRGIGRRFAIVPGPVTKWRAAE